MNPSGVITLITDFGVRDSYVAQMKGVILRIHPGAAIVDITHDIAPQDITQAAFALMTAHQAFPRGTVHLAVVDPGVGGQRKALLVQTAEEFFLGPDNGVLSWALLEKKIIRTISITNENYFLPNVTPTFHARDIFAPVAAHMSRGVHPDEFGRRMSRFVRLSLPAPKKGKGGMEGQVLHCDIFGNLVTNIPARALRGGKGTSRGGRNGVYPGPRWTVVIENVRHGIIDEIHGISRTYIDAPQGRPLALIGSTGFLEISVNKRSARDVYGTGKGLIIRVRPS